MMYLSKLANKKHKTICWKHVVKEYYKPFKTGACLSKEAVWDKHILINIQCIYESLQYL